MPKRLTDEEREKSKERQKQLAKDRYNRWRANNPEKVREHSLKAYYKNKDVDDYIKKHERLIKLFGGQV